MITPKEIDDKVAAEMVAEQMAAAEEQTDRALEAGRRAGVQRNDDEGVRARNEGKARIAAATVWSLEVGGLRIRCLRAEGGYVVQARTSKGWDREVARGPSAEDLFQRTARSRGVLDALAEAAVAARAPGG